MPNIAEELILELFDGQVVSRKQIINDVLQTHVDRNGKSPAGDITRCIKWAGHHMSKKGIVSHIARGLWKIQSDPNSSNGVTSNSEAKPVMPPPVSNKSNSVTSDTSESLTLGSGKGSVYVYYYPRDKSLAESKRKSVWECKVGMSEGDAEVRVKSQSTTAVYEDPEIGLTIRTDNPRALEIAIHGILGLKDRRIGTSGNRKEWFLTSPTEIAGIYTIVSKI